MSFSFYTVDTAYCDYLRKADPCVPYTMDRKSIRPFVGIVFSVNNFQYYAPLTSPKPKHLHMKNQIDFLKINDGKWGAINLNNMIPVQAELLKKVEIKILESDSKADIDYKNLLSNQLSWCNSHREAILRQASKLYHMIINGKAWGNLQDRCCNFTLDEKMCVAFDRSPEREAKTDKDTRPSVLAKLIRPLPETTISKKSKAIDRDDR